MSSKWVSDLILNMFPLCFWLNPPNLMMWKVKHGKYPWYSNRSKVFGWGYKSLAVPYYVAWLLSVSNFESFRVEPQNWQSEKGSSRFQRFQKKIRSQRNMLRTPLGHSCFFFHVPGHRAFDLVSGSVILLNAACIGWSLKGNPKLGLFSIETYDLFLKISYFHPFPTKFGDLKYLRFWVMDGPHQLAIEDQKICGCLDCPEWCCRGAQVEYESWNHGPEEPIWRAMQIIFCTLVAKWWQNGGNRKDHESKQRG